MSLTRLFLITASLVLLFNTAPAEAKMYKCTKNGKIAFQDKPCVKGAKEEVKKTKDERLREKYEIVPIIKGAQLYGKESSLGTETLIYKTKRPLSEIIEFYTNAEKGSCRVHNIGSLECNYGDIDNYKNVRLYAKKHLGGVEIHLYKDSQNIDKIRRDAMKGLDSIFKK